MDSKLKNLLQYGHQIKITCLVDKILLQYLKVNIRKWTAFCEWRCSSFFPIH